LDEPEILRGLPHLYVKSNPGIKIEEPLLLPPIAGAAMSFSLAAKQKARQLQSAPPVFRADPMGG
jgi:hypothetical protein